MVGGQSGRVLADPLGDIGNKTVAAPDPLVCDGNTVAPRLTTAVVTTDRSRASNFGKHQRWQNYLMSS